jgi:hypothetical protein
MKKTNMDKNHVPTPRVVNPNRSTEPRLTKTEKAGLLSLGKRHKLVRSICTDKKMFIEPNTNARVDFIEEFIPKWMRQFGGNTWEVSQRLAEEIEENFQFVPDWQPLPKDQWNNGELRERMSLAHIVVIQQVMLTGFVKDLKKTTKMYNKAAKMYNKLLAEKTKPKND